MVGTSGVFILTTALAGRHHYPHFTHRETEAQRGKVIPGDLTAGTDLPETLPLPWGEEGLEEPLQKGSS